MEDLIPTIVYVKSFRSYRRRLSQKLTSLGVPTKSNGISFPYPHVDSTSNSNRRSVERSSKSISKEKYYPPSLIPKWSQADINTRADDDDLNPKEAEARLAARRQARAEAREIRMRELERQQRESEDSLDRHYDQLSDPVNRSNARLANSAVRAPALLSAGTVGTFSSSRRSSEDSTESEGLSYRDLRHELKELEDKFRKAMINNAQLDNEKSTLLYQVSSLKDEREELEENLAMIQKEHKEKCHDYEQMKRVAACLKEETNLLRRQLEEKDKLIKEHGLVIVCAGSEEEEGSHEKVLVSQETALLLEEAGEGSLDVRLRRFAESKNVLVDEIRRLKIELEEEKSRNLKMSKVSSSTMNGPELDMLEAQREANRLLGDYKFKLQKAEQENSTLQANVARLEGQVVRYKTMAETTEKASDELKIEKRRLQREMRERQTREEELVITNSHLQKRLDKLKTARSALLKDL